MAGLAAHIKDGTMTEAGIKKPSKLLMPTCVALPIFPASVLISLLQQYCAIAPTLAKQLPQSKQALTNASPFSLTKKKLT